MERGSFGRVVVGARRGASSVSGCNLKNGGEDLVNGKKLFVAGMRGLPHARSAPARPASTGPNLDEAFQQSRKDGMKDQHLRRRRRRADPAPQP